MYNNRKNDYDRNPNEPFETFLTSSRPSTNHPDPIEFKPEK